jgi:hypothetical protein
MRKGPVSNHRAFLFHHFIESISLLNRQLLGTLMTNDFDEREAFFNRRTDKTIISKSFKDLLIGKQLRIASHIVDGQAGLRLAQIADEVVLRETPAGRFQIKATFVDDDRSIRSLTIQKYSSKTGPLTDQHFTFVGQEIDALISFIAGIKSVPLDGPAKRHLPDSILRDIVLDQSQARKLFSKNPEVFLQLAQHEDVARDVVAVGYRRKKLKYFEQLLSDPQYFLDELLRLNCKPEALWQKFFEANTWIFGYGLSYQFLSELDGHRLEQVVRGSDLAGRGKRSDAVMKTRGLISSMCFVEIKRHDTSLLDARQYRPSVWSPSSELIGGISQIQKTVHSAIESIGRTLRPADAGGTPTGEVLFNIEPRSILVIGSLKEFQSDRGLNEQMFGSFELFRRNTWRPEIVTFDELLERARFIVEHEPAVREAD